MELVFLTLLILLMIVALGMGFPVAFALPGSAIISIGLAALTGWLFAGNVDAFFAQGGPNQWLNAGVTNFRGVYWEVERDTLIAIPLFIFMGIMLERSRIAEDLLVTMAQLFGPIPGGLGISVVFVGGLLAATTGIVGATVVAMGLISLPVMLRNKYAHFLATGTISASGTLGQIIPPSIVLIILADQLANAVDQASTLRQNAYKEATGEFSMPAEFGVGSASAGDMFMGAFLPGLLLVGLYMAFILGLALFRRKVAPPVPYDGKYDLAFAGRVLLSLVPPLVLIFIVLGSIILGIATVNQAGAIGAVGAMVMAGYRVMAGKRGAYAPALVSVVAVAALAVLLNRFEVNVKSIDDGGELAAALVALVLSIVLLIGVLWSAWRVYRTDDIMHGVMIETAKTTSLVFIILLGAAMLTAAFRSFGGEELVREFLTGLPGGFISKFVVVMAVIFLLGFFLDFIEIAVVVVPIVAPILLADTGANVTAVWLGVMIGINMQTSFLTPPFGFALFYLRGVAPPEVKTLAMYRGVVPFIGLQLLALVIAGLYPSLVNYLPNRTSLLAETAPPPVNPTLQACVEEHVFGVYATRGGELRDQIGQAQALDFSMLPENLQADLSGALEGAATTFDRVADVQFARSELDAFVVGYRPLHRQVRRIEQQVARLGEELEEVTEARNRARRDNNGDPDAVQRLEAQMATLEGEQAALTATIPAAWEDARAQFGQLSGAEKRALLTYRRTVDQAYEPVATALAVVQGADALAGEGEALRGLTAAVGQGSGAEAIQAVEARLREIAMTQDILSPLSRARRALSGDVADVELARDEVADAVAAYDAEVAWRERAAAEIGAPLGAYEAAIRDNIGLRRQERLPREIAKEVAVCRSVHTDISLNF